MTEFQKKQAEFRKRNIKRMIEAMLKAGIRHSEITEATGCSRWALTLWLQQRHTPTRESYKAIQRAHAKLLPHGTPKVPLIIKRLRRRGINVPERLGCAPASVENWLDGVLPQARYRAKLVELYHDRRAA